MSVSPVIILTGIHIRSLKVKFDLVTIVCLNSYYVESK